MNNLIMAADSGDRLETLKALRHLLAARLDKCESNRDVASMSKRLMDCIEEIEELEKKKDESEHDQLEEFRRRCGIRAVR